MPDHLLYLEGPVEIGPRLSQPKVLIVAELLRLLVLSRLVLPLSGRLPSSGRCPLVRHWQSKVGARKVYSRDGQFETGCRDNDF